MGNSSNSCIGYRSVIWNIVDPMPTKHKNVDRVIYPNIHKGEIGDMQGYHKALFAARNADTIAQHFYEQGKADAVKDVMAKSKNISTEPRQTAAGEVFVNGIKVKAMSGVDSSKLKIKKVTIKN